MVTEHDTPSSIAAPPRGHQGRTFESLRERLLAGLPVTERRLSLNGVTTAVLEGGEGAPVVLLRFRWNLRVIDDAADDPALEQPEAFMTALHTALGPSKTQEAGL